MVLRAIVVAGERSHRLQHASAYEQEMADVVDPKHQPVVPIGLQRRFQVSARCLDLVFVRIQHLRPGGLGGGDHALDRDRDQKIVMVEEAHELAPGGGQGRVGGAADPPILLMREQPHPGLPSRQVLHVSRKVRQAAVIIDQDELEMRVGLRQYRVDRRLKIIEPWLVDGADDAHERTGRPSIRGGLVLDPTL